MKGTIEARKSRWVDFYDLKKEPSQMFFLRLPENEPVRPLPHPDKKKERIEWIWEHYLNQMEKTSWLDDDSIPHLDMLTGTEIFAEALGCAVHRPEDTMPFALPFITEASQVSAVKVPGLDTPCLKMLFDMADELRKRGGPEAVFRMVDVQSPMDIAALMWEKTSFFIAMTEPEQIEAIKELAAKAYKLIIIFLEEWFSRYGRGFAAHFPDYYMPEGITLSEDEIGCVSPDTYKELFHPELVKLSEHFGGIGIHCCADSRHQWAGFKSIPGLKLLNLNRTSKVLREAYPFFGSDIAQMHIPTEGSWPITWMEPVKNRVVFQVDAKTKEEAIELAPRIRQKLSNQGNK